MRVKAKHCQKTKIYVSSFLSLGTLFVVEIIIGAEGTWIEAEFLLLGV